MVLRCQTFSKGFKRLRLHFYGRRYLQTYVRNSIAAKDTSNRTAKISSLPDEADVVIIGGGSAGLSTLYNLTKIGITNSVLLESHKLTSGTTWHTAGIISVVQPTDTGIQLTSKTKEIILELEAESDLSTGWLQNGSLVVAESKVKEVECKRTQTFAKALGIDCVWLNPAETKKLYPLINTEDLLGSLYASVNGSIDPSGYCSALAKVATRNGAKIIENCSVTNIVTQPTLMGGRKITEVHTPAGVIKTNCVVNATGCWGNHIANMVGITLPLVIYKHYYIVTERIEGAANMPTIRDSTSSSYIKQQGETLTVGCFELSPVVVEKLENDVPFRLFELDLSTIEELIGGAMKRVPVLGNIGIKSTICGPESFTPDRKPIMGEDPNVGGLFHCCGFNSSGMMLGGGCGHQLALWIQQGRPELDMFSYDIRRFNPALLSNKTWIRERSHEVFSGRYAVSYPHDEPLSARNQKKSPLHNILESSGSVFQDRFGWERPGWFNSSPCPVQNYDWNGAYGTPANEDTRYKMALEAVCTFNFPENHHVIKHECLSARTKAALFDESSFGKFFLTGPDAQTAADRIFSADVQQCPGTIIYSAMLNDKGGTEADLTVNVVSGHEMCSDEPRFTGKGFYLVVECGLTTQTWAHVLQEIRKHEWNVDLIDYTERVAVLSLQGPLSRDILQQLTDDDLGNNSFPYMSHRPIKVAGHLVRALRVSYIGELGWELHMPLLSAVPVYEALHKVGTKYGLVNAGFLAMDSLAAEKGTLHWHSDLRTTDTPIEAELGFICKLDTSVPFIGREALEKQKKEGVRRRLIRLTLEDPTIPLWGFEGIYKDGRIAGFVRRAEYAFYLGRSIANGYVQSSEGNFITEDFLVGGNWEIDLMGIKHKASLHRKSPFDPRNERLQGKY